MELLKYLKVNEITQRSFAKNLGTSPNYLSLILHGKVTPGLYMAYKIERLTGKEVTIYDWIRSDWKNF